MTMTMAIHPMFGMHGHAAGRGFLLLMVVLGVILVIACWPAKSENK